MSIASKYNKGSRFNYQWPTKEEATYAKLQGLYDVNNTDKVFTVRALLIGTKGKFGDEPVIGLDNNIIVNCPKHMVEVINMMLEDDDAIEAINAGKLGFKVRTYVDKTFGKLCYAVEWVDID